MRRSLTLAFIAFVALVGFTTSSEAQNAAADRLHAWMKDNDAKIDEYLAKHPVRQSLLFESAASLLATLAKFDAMILGACEYVADLPDWQEAARGLRENTLLALGKSYLNGKRQYMRDTPLAQEMQDQTLCADDEQDRIWLYVRLRGVFVALRKQGY